MRTSLITRVAAATLAWGLCASHAQAQAPTQEPVPALPEMASRGVQCQLVEEALFALVQIGPRDGADSLSARSLQRLRGDMQPQTLQLYDSLARSYGGSDAYENGAQAYSAAVGRYVDRALRACAGAWFADADADRVNACAKANLAGTAIANARRRGIAAAEALQIAQKAAPVGAPSAREMVEHFYRFPVSAYEQAQGATRIVGGAKELCLDGAWQPPAGG